MNCDMDKSIIFLLAAIARHTGFKVDLRYSREVLCAGCDVLPAAVVNLEEAKAAADRCSGSQILEIRRRSKNEKELNPRLKTL